MSKRLEKVIGHITQADRMLDAFNRERVAPAYQEAFGEFLKLEDLEERLGDRRFIGYTFEDVEGLWYQALLIPQKYEQDKDVYKRQTWYSEYVDGDFCRRGSYGDCSS